jgi:hypothetical protein
LSALSLPLAVANMTASGVVGFPARYRLHVAVSLVERFAAVLFAFCEVVGYFTVRTRKTSV